MWNASDPNTCHSRWSTQRTEYHPLALGLDGDYREPRQLPQRRCQARPRGSQKAPAVSPRPRPRPGAAGGPERGWAAAPAPARRSGQRHLPSRPRRSGSGARCGHRRCGPERSGAGRPGPAAVSLGARRGSRAALASSSLLGNTDNGRAVTQVQSVTWNIVLGPPTPTLKVLTLRLGNPARSHGRPKALAAAPRARCDGDGQAGRSPRDTEPWSPPRNSAARRNGERGGAPAGARCPPSLPAAAHLPSEGRGRRRKGREGRGRRRKGSWHLDPLARGAQAASPHYRFSPFRKARGRIGKSLWRSWTAKLGN